MAKVVKQKNGEYIYMVASFEYNEFIQWFKQYSVGTDIRVILGDKLFYRQGEFHSISNDDFYISKNYENIGIFIEFYKEDHIVDLLKKSYKMYIIKITSLIIIITIAAYIFSNNLNYPFSEIKDASNKIINGDYEVRVKRDGYLKELRDSFNDMAEKNQNMNQEFVKYAFTMLEKNDKLSKLNLQLEESYDQLKTITEMLEFSENKYSALFDNISDFIWTCDDNNIFTYANDVMCETLGYHKEELIGISCKDIFLSIETVDEVSNVKEEMNFTKKNYHNINILVKCKNGEEKIFSANSKKIFDSGKLIGSQGTARTIMFEEIIQTKILRKNKEFETIKEIILSLTKVNNLKELLNTVSKNVYQLFSPELCTIRTYNNGYLEFFNKIGEYDASERYSTFHIDDDCSGDAIKENKIIRISDFENSKFANREELLYLFEEIEEIITVPIMVKEEPFGTIHLCMKEKLKDSDMKILKTLSNQASIAVDKLKLYDSLKEDYINTIRVLASAVEAKDKYTEGHSLRVSKIAYLIGEEMNFENSELEELEIAGTLHDIGKIGIDDEILTKEGKLTLEEYLIIKEHPAIGEKILRPIGLSKNIIEGVLFHHKRYDLKGYPETEKLDELGKFPSIIGVADALDAMTSNRTYAKSRSLEEAMAEIYRYSDTQFNPYVVEALSNIIKNRRDYIMELIKL